MEIEIGKKQDDVQQKITIMDQIDLFDQQITKLMENKDQLVLVFLN